MPAVSETLEEELHQQRGAQHQHQPSPGEAVVYHGAHNAQLLES